MKSQMISKLFLSLVGAIALLGMTAANAAEKQHLVIHVDSSDVATQNLAMNNAVNVQKHFGMDNVEIEIVAYGPGLKMLTADSKTAQRVSSLSQQGVTFSACGNTMKKMAKKTGKMPVLAEGVRQVPAGVIRIMELQDAGWNYLRP